MAAEKSELVRIREARQLIDRMRDRLLRPSFESLAGCAMDLRLAVECIRRLDAKLPIWRGMQRKALEAEVIGLRRDIQFVEALLTNAGKFYAGWARLLASDQAPPNYTPSGSIGAAAVKACQLVIHG
jgi:hypothetical protein